MIPVVEKGSSPLLLAQPHGGTEIPQSIMARLNQHGQAQADTDWHIMHLKDPQSVVPDSAMPPYGHLTEGELKTLADYMLSLK